MLRPLLRRLLAVAAPLALALACSNEPTAPGPPASITVSSGNAQSALAATALPQPVVLTVKDAKGRGVSGQTVTFTVTEGDGSLAATTAVTDASGNVTLPTWVLGKLALAQAVRATVGSASVVVTATVATQYAIVINFFGTPMTSAQQALFTTAAARIRGIVTGDLPNVNSGTVDLATVCGVAGLPTLTNEIIEDVLIYAAVQPIDGEGKILAQSGPCLVRSGGGLTAVGVMSFDVADIASLGTGGQLQDVITHEMLHVLGIGTFWNSRGLLADTSSAPPNDPVYTGPRAAAACIEAGGAAVCSANRVPVENTGGAGTRLGHWRESVFDTELMTGFAERGPMPLSIITIGGLEDLGYVVNRAARDPYTVPAPGTVALRRVQPSEAWESQLPAAPRTITPDGRLGPRTPR